MIRLSVNVNKLATLRNARGKNLPDVTQWAEKILEYGANGITVHPRPDGRHIRSADVAAIHDLITRWNSGRSSAEQAEFNMEGFPSSEFLALVNEVQPNQCTLVPDPPEALTSNAGWNLVESTERLQRALKTLRQAKVRVSLFIDPFNFDSAQAQALTHLMPERIELYTEAFAESLLTSQAEPVAEQYRRVALAAKQANIGVNAGHDLNQGNLAALVRLVPWLDEVSIGHALICEALSDGMKKTVQNYLAILGTL